MRPDKPKTQKGLTPFAGVRPYQLFSRQSVAGFTLLAFLLTQLTWSLPTFARDSLRGEAVSQSAGLEELKARFEEDHPVPGAAPGASAGLEGSTEYRMNLDQVALSRLQPFLKGFLRTVIIPKLFGVTANGEKVTPSDHEVLLENFLREVRKGTSSNASAQRLLDLILEKRKQSNVHDELLRWVNAYFLLPHGVALFSVLSRTIDEPRSSTRNIYLVPADGYELYELGPDLPPVPVVYTAVFPPSQEDSEGFTERAGSVFIRVNHQMEKMKQTRHEELSHVSHELLSSPQIKVFRNYDDVFEKAGLLPQAELRAYLPTVSHEIPYVAWKIFQEFRHQVQEILGPNPEETYTNVFLIARISSPEMLARGLRESEGTPYEALSKALHFLSMKLRKLDPNLDLTSENPTPEILSQFQHVTRIAWAQESTLQIEPVQLKRVYPLTDREAESQLERLAVNAAQTSTESGLEEPTDKNVRGVISLLREGNPDERFTAVNTVVRWLRLKPQASSLVLARSRLEIELIANLTYDESQVIYPGPTALDLFAFLHSPHDIRRASVEALGLAKQQWGESAALASLLQALRQDENGRVRAAAVRAIDAFRDPAVLPALIQVLQRENDEEVLVATIRAIRPIGNASVLSALIHTLLSDWRRPLGAYEGVLQEAADTLIYFQPAFQNLPLQALTSVLIFHPEWVKTPPPTEKLVSFTQAISYLPPVGGKVPLIIEGPLIWNGNFPPSWTAEEQIRFLLAQRQRRELGKEYVHQVTVQGRLPDEFKYVALALILSSPYRSDWEKPFFDAPWGKAAPLVHDGEMVETGLNPLWKDLPGRTDFLQRIAVVYEPDLEALESLSDKERRRRLQEDPQLAERFEKEQMERDRLLIEARAYQRLALALHAARDTAPEAIPLEIRRKLATRWNTFKTSMRALLGEQRLGSAVDVPWFLEQPRQVPGWPGPRHEADWPPIRDQLLRLNDFAEREPKLYDSLRLHVISLLKRTADGIDRDLGLQSGLEGQSVRFRSPSLLHSFLVSDLENRLHPYPSPLTLPNVAEWVPQFINGVRFLNERIHVSASVQDVIVPLTSDEVIDLYRILVFSEIGTKYPLDVDFWRRLSAKNSARYEVFSGDEGRTNRIVRSMHPIDRMMDLEQLYQDGTLSDKQWRELLGGLAEDFGQAESAKEALARIDEEQGYGKFEDDSIGVILTPGIRAVMLMLAHNKLDLNELVAALILRRLEDALSQVNSMFKPDSVLHSDSPLAMAEFTELTFLPPELHLFANLGYPFISRDNVLQVSHLPEGSEIGFGPFEYRLGEVPDDALSAVAGIVSFPFQDTRVSSWEKVEKFLEEDRSTTRPLGETMSLDRIRWWLTGDPAASYETAKQQAFIVWPIFSSAFQMDEFATALRNVHAQADQPLTDEEISRVAGQFNLQGQQPESVKGFIARTAQLLGITKSGLEEIALIRKTIENYINRPDVQKSLAETSGMLRLMEAQMAELGVPPGVRGGVILRLDQARLDQLPGLLFAQPNVRGAVPAALRDLPWVELADDPAQAGSELKNAHAEFGRDLALFEAREGLTPEAIQAGLEASRYENHPRIVLLRSEQVGSLTRHLLVYFATAKREDLSPVIIPILMDVIQDSYGNFHAVALWA